MPRSTLAGSRIRERRMMMGLRQAALAKGVGISASYLNLIEHNRRRIGGKLLLDLAAMLEVEPSLLSEGAEEALIARLRDVAVSGDEGAEIARVDEFAGRFPGWARLLVQTQRRVAGLERSVATLTDRLTHDPHLADTLHEVLSTVTSIRSTAGILVETKEIEPEWRDRFLRNINEDAKRLADGAQALVGFLEEAEDAQSNFTSPQEEVEAFLATRGYHFATLEAGGDGTPQSCVDAGAELISGSAKVLALAHLTRYERDARQMPLREVIKYVRIDGYDPGALAARFGAGLSAAMRRLASLPPQDDKANEIGLVICDASGTLTFRKQIEGFALPRFSAACPIWPLFQAISRPLTPIYHRISQTGRGDDISAGGPFEAYAIAQPVGVPAFNRDPLFEAHMLIVPAKSGGGNNANGGGRDVTREPLVVGATCRICPRQECFGRREPSILADGF